jgi:outer membrane protein assembly factor BamB
MVYLSSAGNGTGYALRMTREGKDKIGGSVVYATANATANRSGQIAVASGHFAHVVTIYNKSFEKSAAQTDFLVSDAVGWDAPIHVEAGESGDFYGADQHRDRILRISPDGKLLKAYPIPHSPEGNGGLMTDFRVNEKLERFYVMTRQGPLRAIGFDGQQKWSAPIPAGWMNGGFDVDEAGVLYAIGGREDTVKKFAPDGTSAGEIKLQMGDAKPTPTSPWIQSLRVFGNEVLLKRNHPTELFQRYAINSGDRQGVVTADHERLTVNYEKEIWIAGESLPFSIAFDSGHHTSKPLWRAWLRPLNSPFYQELKQEAGKVLVPADAAGIYQLKVSPETQPLEAGKISEYITRGWVEIRQPNTRGTASVFTPQNRVYYAAGETIPLSVIVRSTGEKSTPLTIRLSEKKTGGAVIAETRATPDANGVLSLSLPPTLTRALEAGNYMVSAGGNGLSSAPQYLTIGSGDDGTDFQIVRFGDYGETYPKASLWSATDVVASHVARERKLGFNFYADRIGTPLQMGALDWGGQDNTSINELVKKLEADAAGVAPEKVRVGSVLHQVMAAYSAQGMTEMPILLMMDAGLPIGGPGFDNRKPEQLQKDIEKVTNALLPYPSFRGWVWHSNWWIYKNNGADAAKTPEEKTAYEAALKKAQETGVWDEVLDRVSGYRLGYAVEAQEMFNKTLRAVAPNRKLATASSGTYRNVNAYPPLSFQNVDEVDLQGQFEQIFLPYFPPHAVDFYRRPGKPVWGHPEIWNDSGTGDQIMPMLFSMFMRGVDGTGPSGRVPPWSGDRVDGAWCEDPRHSYYGTSSVFRATNNLFKRYGSWMRTLQSDDRVAIAVSGRPFKVDSWVNVTGRHFARVMEAWVSCLHAHHPATFVFAEDVKPDSFKNYKAVLVVGQYMEMEPALLASLKNAQAGGTRVLYDGTSRAELFKEFTPLGISFDKFEKDTHAASDDAAYYRFPQYVRANLPTLQKVLDGIAPPVARIENPEVWASQRTSGSGKFLFVVNNTSPAMEPGQIWRTTTLQASRVPVEANIGITASPAIYDIFEMKKVTAPDNALTADLRDLPMRAYALLPAAVESVALRGPGTANAGQNFKWWAQVRAAGNKAIDASIPLRVRLLAPDGSTLREQFVAADDAGISGEFAAPWSTPAGNLILEATELFSGESTRLAIAVKAASLPVAFNANPGAANADTSGKAERVAIPPTVQEFGAHLRDVTILNSGRVAVLNSNNWNQNLLGLDLETGKTLWRGKAGDYFAFAPNAVNNGFTVQGFDYKSAEGYHLYIADETGRLARRFALYGLPRRLPHRFVPGLFGDRDNPINNFATPRDGSWVASAGDLGLVVWSRDGKPLWSQDWWKGKRHTARLAAPDASTLVVAPIGEGSALNAYDAQSGKEKWKLQLAPTGTVQRIVSSEDGKTLAVATNYQGGRIFLVRGGKLVNAVPTEALDLALAPDGERLVVIEQNLLKMYGLSDGLRWSFAGDDVLRAPRFSPDGKRLALGSEIGTVYVLDDTGRVLLNRDNNALTVPAWLPGGDLLLANWMGKAERLDASYKPKWSTLLRSTAAPATAPTEIPTLQATRWSNAQAQPLPLTPNLLTETQAIIRFVAEGANHVRFDQPYAPLADGKTDVPEKPWLSWSDVNWFAEAGPKLSVEFDAFRTQMRVEAITFHEDPAHPESWLRDAALEYWDADKEQWIYAMNLLSNSAVHTHLLPKPVESGKLRVVIPQGLFGNLRWSEITLHGQALGASHADVVAKRPRAVLFDESDEFKAIYPYPDRWGFVFEGAYSGGRFLRVNANQTIAPTFYPVYGHTVPTWDFEIAENPQPGQYRWVQFAVKALGPNARGASLFLHGEGGAATLHIGEASPNFNGTKLSLGDAVPTEWKTYRVDLWDLVKKPMRIRSAYFGALGDAAGFDQLVLARSQDDLPPLKE